MKNHRAAILLLSMLAVSLQAQEDGGFELTNGQIIGIAGGGAAAAGVAAFFVIRHMVRDRRHGDSIIAVFESTHAAAARSWESGEYVTAWKAWRGIQPSWAEYDRYCRKRKRTIAIGSDTLNRRIADCELLESVSPSIKQARVISDALPVDPLALVERDRHAILGQIRTCREMIDAIGQSNPGRAPAVRFGFRHTIARLNAVDSLYKTVYEQQRLNFELKNRFFYNRAAESRDTTNLRRFVDDCGYYKVEKSWCEKARLALNPVASAAPEAPSPAKVIPVSPVETEYHEAVRSKRIDLLEAYAKKYSSRKYRAARGKVDTVKIVLDSLKRELDAEVAYNRSHPLLANGDLAALQFASRGLDQSLTDRFKSVLGSMEAQLRGVDGVRFPAGLMLDYASTPPVLIMNGFINCKRDAEVTAAMESGGMEAKLRGAPGSALFLHRLKSAVVADMRKSNSPADKLRAVESAVYVVRLRKSKDEYVTFYAKPGDNGRGVEFYEFFDVSADGQKDVRFKNAPTHVIVPLPKSDPRAVALPNRLILKFFEL